MKTIQLLFLGLILLFSVNKSWAQNGYGGYNNGGGYGNNRMGMNHNTSPGLGSEKKSDADIEKEKKANFDKAIGKLKTELNLDELQVIAVGNILQQSMKTQGIILKKETDQTEKVTEIQALGETTDRKVMEMLNKDQKQKYLVMKDNMNDNSSKKSKK